MPRALILIAGHLCNAPRPQKEAAALAAAGWDVAVRGMWYDDVLAQRDVDLLSHRGFSYAPLLDFRPRPHGGRSTRLQVRAEGRLARSVYRVMGHAMPATFGYGARAMVRAARDARADLTIVHSEAGLWAAQQLQRAGHRVGVDFEDWFSEDLLPEARRQRPVAQLKLLERTLAATCTYALAPSHALSAALARAYDVPEPTVIYNTFPVAEAGPRSSAVADWRDPRVVSLHWFSQTIGPGRGLELLFAALPQLRGPVEVHLRGTLGAGARAWLDEVLPASARGMVHCHPAVPAAELPRRIAEHDIGLALELPYCPNKDLTASNKLFQYLLAGVPVIATSTAGQREVMARCPDAGTVMGTNIAHELASAIDAYREDPAKLAAARRAAGNAHASIGWAGEAGKLVALAHRAAGTRP